jgi:hypothetical protein
MAVCPFFRVECIKIERRKKPREGTPAPMTGTVPAPWCAHLYSPVSKYLATRVVGGADKLRCGGDLEKCHIPVKQRPKL